MIKELEQECIKEKMEEIVRAADIAKSIDENPDDYWKAQVMLKNEQGKEHQGGEQGKAEHKSLNDPKPVVVDASKDP